VSILNIQVINHLRQIFLKSKDKVKLVGWRWRWIYEDGTVIEQNNYLPNSGLAILAALICGEQTNSCSWHIARGTGTTAAAAGDTTLEAEDNRKAKALMWREGYTVKVRAYLLSSEAIGTWTEWGLFVAGTDMVNSGQLVSRILPVGGVTKTGGSPGQVMTAEIDITLARGD
jgi:hypothetical protein